MNVGSLPPTGAGSGRMPRLVVDCQCELGEGPLWSDRDQCLWFVDIEGRCVHRMDPLCKRAKRFALPGRPGFIVEASDGSFVIGMEDALYGADRGFTVLQRLGTIAGLPASHRINDGFVDAQGRLWFGTLNEREDAPTGQLYRCQDGRIEVVEQGSCVVTNGPAVSPCGRTLYLSDSLERRVFAFDVSTGGNLTNKRLFAQFSTTDGYPDGLAVDRLGRVWISLFGGWGVRCHDRAGALVDRVELPVANATKVAFGGENLTTAYITTARTGLTRSELQQQPFAGALFAFDIEVPGRLRHEAHACFGRQSGP